MKINQNGLMKAVYLSMLLGLGTLLIFAGVCLASAQENNGPLSLIENGQIGQALVSPYTSVIGDLFWCVPYFTATGIAAIKWQDMGPVSIVLVIGAAMMFPFFDATVRFICAVCAIIGVASLLWRLMKK